MHVYHAHSSEWREALYTSELRESCHMNMDEYRYSNTNDPFLVVDDIYHTHMRESSGSCDTYQTHMRVNSAIHVTCITHTCVCSASHVTCITYA